MKPRIESIRIADDRSGQDEAAIEVTVGAWSIMDEVLLELLIS